MLVPLALVPVGSSSDGGRSFLAAVALASVLWVLGISATVLLWRSGRLHELRWVPACLLATGAALSLPCAAWAGTGSWWWTQAASLVAMVAAPVSLSNLGLSPPWWGRGRLDDREALRERLRG